MAWDLSIGNYLFFAVFINFFLTFRLIKWQSWEAGIAKIISLEEETHTAEKELKNLKEIFQVAIEAITNTEYHDILTKRYLEFKDWIIIAEEMGYSEPSCYRLHREALALMKS